MKAYRLSAALVAWAALLLQYWLMIQGRPPGEIAGLTVRFFSYFTILSNLAAALALTLPLVRPNGWWSRAAVRGGILVFITVVMVVYHLLLRATWDPRGLQKIVDYALHYVCPIAFLMDWALFVPKGRLKWRDAFVWLAFPAIYGVWTLVHGAFSGFYPYPFMDVGELGYLAVLRNMAFLVVGFLAPGLLLVAIDRLLGRRDTVAASP